MKLLLIIFYYTTLPGLLIVASIDALIQRRFGARRMHERWQGNIACILLFKAVLLFEGEK